MKSDTHAYSHTPPNLAQIFLLSLDGAWFFYCGQCFSVLFFDLHQADRACLAHRFANFLKGVLHGLNSSLLNPCLAMDCTLFFVSLLSVSL